MTPAIHNASVVKKSVLFTGWVKQTRVPNRQRIKERQTPMGAIRNRAKRAASKVFPQPPLPPTKVARASSAITPVPRAQRTLSP